MRTADSETRAALVASGLCLLLLLAACAPGATQTQSSQDRLKPARGREKARIP
ncbi:MAG: hypothetical protein LC800_18220 [Acidobacteria bacterium]|nr:hypothetical protein [Acidobacteriota bacterium]